MSLITIIETFIGILKKVMEVLTEPRRYSAGCEMIGETTYSDNVH